jgi:hypothetical protein
MNILEQVIAGLIVIVISAMVVNVWMHRHNPREALGGLGRKIAKVLQKQETDAQREARRERELLESDDSDIWKPIR